MSGNYQRSEHTKRDQTHMEQVVRWAEFVKGWKKSIIQIELYLSSFQISF